MSTIKRAFMNNSTLKPGSFSQKQREAFGRKIYKLRTGAGMSRTYLAGKLNRTQSLIQSLEAGESGLEINTLLGLKDIFQADSLEDLLFNNL
jgi:ribosome-binding protein aMBF1 (putative translation factor)